MLHPPNLSISDNMQLVLRAVACLGIIGIIARVYLPTSKSGLPLPPSPPTWRLRGHLLPPRSSFLTVAGWIDEYGPLITIRSGLEKIVIIGRYEAAVDIMENQGKSLVDRPRRIAAGEMLSGGISIAFAPFGERYLRMRRALHTHLQRKAAEAYQPLQMSLAKNTVLDILDDPYNFQNHLTTYAATTITKVVYGKTTPTYSTDPEVVEVNELVRVARTIVRPGAYLVDTIPWLKYLPWYGQELKQWFERTTRFNMGHLNSVKEQMQSNVNIGPSFMKYMLESGNLSEAETASLAGALFAAGSSSTSLSICTVLMAACCFPEEQTIVQAELDAVIGRHRAPTFADQESLPRLCAFISEALRWRPTVPDGLPHRTTQDVIWGNYCIPAGTTVFGNQWSISRDPEVYPEPCVFKPHRWIDDQGCLRDNLKLFVYGFGRRYAPSFSHSFLHNFSFSACPGQHVANRSIFINSLLILWAFRLALDPTKPLDDMGFMNAGTSTRPCAIEFEMRIPEPELRRMLQNYPEVA